MRTLLPLLLLTASLALPAKAQFREAVPTASHAPAQLYDSGFSLNKLFHPSVFKMSHAFEASTGSFGGTTHSLGVYTNSLAWQFSDKLAARVDLSVAYSPQNGAGSAAGLQQGQPKVFLRSADIAWRPSKKVTVHVQVHQNPYGRYANPYGYSGGYGYGHGFGHDAYMYDGFSRSMFWRDSYR